MHRQGKRPCITRYGKKCPAQVPPSSSLFVPSGQVVLLHTTPSRKLGVPWALVRLALVRLALLNVVLAMVAPRRVAFDRLADVRTASDGSVMSAPEPAYEHDEAGYVLI